MYKQLISLFNRDTAFRIMKGQIRMLGKIPFARALIRMGHKSKSSKLEREVLGLKLSNPIGLGPGLDKKGQLYNTLYDFGFSFTDIGPVSLANVKTIISNLQSNPADPVIGMCINKDHAKVFSLAYDFADFFDMEIPDSDTEKVLDEIFNIRLAYENYKPVLLRLTHDLPQEQLEKILSFALMGGIDGFVVAKSDNVRRVYDYTKGRFPIIGYGGIRTPEMAREILDAGAQLLEVTTGLVLDGPNLARKLLRHLYSQ